MSFQQTHPQESPIVADTKQTRTPSKTSSSLSFWSKYVNCRHSSKQHILRVVNHHHTHKVMVILIPSEKQIAMNQFEQMIHSSTEQNHRRDSMMVIQNRQYEKIKGFTAFTTLRPYAGSSSSFGSGEHHHDFVLYNNRRKKSSDYVIQHDHDPSNLFVKVLLIFSKEGNLYHYAGQQTIDLSTATCTNDNDCNVTNFSVETQCCVHLPIVRIHTSPGNQSVSISTLEEHVKKASKLKRKMIFGH